MKCKLCNQKTGSTRCEGCNTLLCLPCMNKHHDELLQQFQQLMDIRNELKESLDTKLQNENKLSCLIEIDLWEQKTITRIREIAGQVRINITEMISMNAVEVHNRFEQFSVNMQQQEKEGNYLENSIEDVKRQLNDLNHSIQHVNEKIQVTTSNDVNWNALIHITTTNNLGEDCCIPSEYFMRQRNTEKEFQNNQQKLSHKKSTSRYRSNKQSTFRPATPLLLESDHSNSFRPISPPVFLQDNSSDSDSDLPLISIIVPPDRLVSILPNQGQPFTWTTMLDIGVCNGNN
jgi:hypothetical protein